jgi:hypothetical protein
VNETYAGRMYYAKTQILKDGRQVPRPRNEWIPIDVPHLALIDRKTFQMAETRAKRNQERASRNRKYDYLLVGHIRCGSCNLAMYGFRKWEGSKPYYRCASYNNKLAHCSFTKRSIQMERADKAVWQWLSSMLENEEVLLEGVRAMAQRREEELEPKREQYAYIMKALQSSDDKIRRLIDELAEFGGSTARAVIKEKINQMEAEQSLLMQEKARLEEELAELEISPEVESRVTEIAALVRERLPVATFEGMRELLEILKVKVRFYQIEEGIKLQVSCEIPGSEGDIIFTSF